MKKNKKLFWILPAVLGIFALLSAVVMVLWNWILPAVTDFRPITYWQAAGLLILTRILFGSFRRGFGPFGGSHHFHDHRNHLHEKWRNMSEEERAEFINRRRENWHRHAFDEREFYGRRGKFGSTENGKENER